MGMCVCVCACGRVRLPRVRVRVCARACVCVRACPLAPASWRPAPPPVRPDSSPSPAPKSPIGAAAACLAWRGRAVCAYSACRSILGLPLGPAPRPMPSAMPPAVQSAIPAVLSPPQPAHTITAHTRMAAACAARETAHELAHANGVVVLADGLQAKLRDCPRHRPEAVRGTWGTRSTHGYARVSPAL